MTAGKWSPEYALVARLRGLTLPTNTMCLGMSASRFPFSNTLIRVFASVLLLGLSLLLSSGCATQSLLSATEYRHNRVTRYEWEIGRVQEAYLGPEQQVLLKLMAQAPKKRRAELHYVILPFGDLVDAVAYGRIEESQMPDAESRKFLYSPEPQTTTGPTFRSSGGGSFQPRRYGLHGRPGPQSFPLRIARGTMTTERPEAFRDGDAEWRPIPVSKFATPLVDDCRWHNLQRLEPPGDHDVAIYQGFSRSPPMAFALVSAQPILDDNHSLAFHKPDPEYDHALHQKPWIVLGRVFLPVTVAFDVVTAPIQIPVILYVIHNMQWP